MRIGVRVWVRVGVRVWVRVRVRVGRSEYTRGRHWRHGHFSNIVILAEFWHVMFKQLTSNTIFLR